MINILMKAVQLYGIKTTGEGEGQRDEVLETSMPRQYIVHLKSLLIINSRSSFSPVCPNIAWEINGLPSNKTGQP
jgi:hypothetical protein